MNDGKILNKKQLNEWLDYEKRRYPYFSALNYLLKSSEISVIWKHQVLLRKTEYHINAKHPLRMRIMLLRLGRMQNKYALHIPPNVCQKGLKIMHLGPILINGKAKIGQNCSLHINTAVVAGGSDDLAPKLGNDIVIGVGAVVLGGVSISDGVAIGAGAVVNKDVTEPDIAIAGVPAKKISNNGSRNWGNRNSD